MEYNIKCQHCSYTWTYSGLSIYAACPTCHRTTPVPNVRAHLEALAKEQAQQFKKKEEGIHNERKPPMDNRRSSRRKPNSPS